MIARLGTYFRHGVEKSVMEFCLLPYHRIFFQSTSMNIASIVGTGTGFMKTKTYIHIVHIHIVYILFFANTFLLYV